MEENFIHIPVHAVYIGRGGPKANYLWESSTENIGDASKESSSIFGSLRDFFGKKEPLTDSSTKYIPGIYIHGGEVSFFHSLHYAYLLQVLAVGGGKTFLMDIFFDAATSL